MKKLLILCLGLVIFVFCKGSENDRVTPISLKGTIWGSSTTHSGQKNGILIHFHYDSDYCDFIFIGGNVPIVAYENIEYEITGNEAIIQVGEAKMKFAIEDSNNMTLQMMNPTGEYSGNLPETDSLKKLDW